MCFVLLSYTGLIATLVNALFIGGCGVGLLLVLNVGVNVASNNLLHDLVDFVGQAESRQCFRWSAVEVRAAVFPAAVTGGLPLAGYFLVVEDVRDTFSEMEMSIIWSVVGFTAAVGPFLSLSFVWGCVVIIRLVAALLRASVDKVFERLEATMMCEELSSEEMVHELDVFCREAKRVFEKANMCITRQVFSCVVVGYMASLVMILELVVALRAGGVSTFILLCFGGMCIVSSAISTALLYSLTSVADHYEDMASDFSHNIELRFKITNAFPGPPGVKLFCSFESEFVNDLSFNFHHRPLDARVLESTILRLFMGAVVTVGLGILTG
eukprot:CAMPEP_0171070564 /NCGR_PEP_ID=MMETSP0766_2-20121228/9826_1 /TAXON_ID=439317 /ORGANISM="Gambierdiscus australes, Strain CAWD 149" /LENGTH=325 /DNA_ID=CAMNT_0011527057 /DNA_START=88 /DNA_END=1065 /DNA_ORIENTATION=-